MRVIAGQFRSRVLTAPHGSRTRPTSDRLRETLFNVLGERVLGARFVDLYAGSGAVGIEALSRGAELCLFVEHTPAAVSALRKNLRTLGIAGGFALDTRPVGRALPALPLQPSNLIFLDPPYEAALEYSATLNLLAQWHREWLAPGAVVVAEHARRSALPSRVGVLERTRLLEQGDAALSFFSVAQGGGSQNDNDPLPSGH